MVPLQLAVALGTSLSVCLSVCLFLWPSAVKVEEFSFQNHFKSTRKEEQQILDRNTLPTALQDVYRYDNILLMIKTAMFSIL